MKQGRASRDVAEGGKREPKAYAVSPSAAGQLGMAMGTLPGHRYAAPQLFQGNGYQAPKNKSAATSKGGSQGKY
jgi:hypothetical protein